MNTTGRLHGFTVVADATMDQALLHYDRNPIGALVESTQSLSETATALINLMKNVASQDLVTALESHDEVALHIEALILMSGATFATIAKYAQEMGFTMNTRAVVFSPIMEEVLRLDDEE